MRKFRTFIRGFDCFFRGLYLSIKHIKIVRREKAFIGGHQWHIFYEDNPSNPELNTIEVSRCKYCGKIDVTIMDEDANDDFNNIVM